MSSAQLYLATNIFERLSRSRDVDGEDDLEQEGDRPVMDMETFMSTVGGEGSAGASQSSSVRHKRPSSAPRQRPSPANRSKMSTREERAERRRGFEQFLARQNQRESRRQKRIEEVRKQEDGKCVSKPKICRKSAELARSSMQGTFLQRVAKDALRKEHEALRQKASSAEDPECTLSRPSIRTPKAGGRDPLWR